MYYTNIKHYKRLKERNDDVAGICLVVVGIVHIVIISLVFMLA